MTKIDERTVPYWHVNIPEAQRTTECPESLQNLSEKDVGIISTLNSDYHVQTWPEGRFDNPTVSSIALNNVTVQDLCLQNRLDQFQRCPSELRRYRQYMWELNRQYVPQIR